MRAPLFLMATGAVLKQEWAKGIIQATLDKEHKEVTMVIDTQWQRSLLISIKRCS